MRSGEHIVVGTDGSDGARRALTWAVDHAGPDDTIEVVHTWNLPVTVAEAGFSLDPALFSDAAEEVLAQEVAFARTSVTTSVAGHITQGHPGAALIDAAKDADLLVVGTRGRGGFVGLLLGSTSTYLVHHASCPLVVVPPAGV